MTGSPLWDFALDFYGRPGVSAACLALQDEAGADVVHLIAVVYADWIGRPLSAEDLAGLRAMMAEWRAGAVLPLRAVRRFLKAPLAGLDAERELLRGTVKAAELEAERLQLAMAQAWLDARAPGTGLPLSQALDAVLSAPPGAASPAVQKALATLLSARQGE